MDYFIIGYKNENRNPIIDFLLDEINDEDNVYVYTDEPIFSLPKGVCFVGNDTFKNKLPDTIYLDIPNYYINDWLDVVNTWGCQEVIVLGD